MGTENAWLPPTSRDATTPVDAVRGFVFSSGRTWFQTHGHLDAYLAQLTPQQFRVLALVAEGLLNKQIADRLGVQERTVKAHLTAIFERLGVRNRTQASVVLRELELSDPARQI